MLRLSRMLVVFILIALGLLGVFGYVLYRAQLTPLVGYEFLALHSITILAVSVITLIGAAIGINFLSPHFQLRKRFDNLPISVKINVVFLGVGIIITLISIFRSVAFYSSFFEVSNSHIPRLHASYQIELVTKDLQQLLMNGEKSDQAAMSSQIEALQLAVEEYLETAPNSLRIQRTIELGARTAAFIAAIETHQQSAVTTSTEEKPTLAAALQAGEQIEQYIDTQLKSTIRQEAAFDRDVVAPLILISSVIIIILLAFAVWVGTLLAQAIIQPISALTEAAKSVANGNLHYTLKIDRTDEVGQLSQAFSSMVQIIHSSQEHAEEETDRVKEQKIILQTILDHIPVGVLFIETKKNTIVSVNTKAQQLFDVSEVVVANLPQNILFHNLFTTDGALYPTAEIAPVKTVSTGRLEANHDMVIVRPDSTRVAINMIAAPIHNIRQELEAVVVLIQDVTREREVERVKNEFISLVSHQLRTPLTALKWFGELLSSGDAGPMTPEQLGYLTHMNESNERMIELVNSLLNISRIESGKIILSKKPSNLADLLSGVIKDVQGKVDEKKHTLKVLITPNIPKVLIDPQLVRQVYLNLLSNAIKYTPDGGVITVEITQSEGAILSRVADTGYGIPEHDHDKVFSKFYRGENITPIETEGTGLGLYLTKSIVESSGGKIWFQSLPGQGTTFWFSLPIAP